MGMPIINSSKYGNLVFTFSVEFPQQLISNTQELYTMLSFSAPQIVSEDSPDKLVINS
jgi:DnaJ-class molecular chaperone